MLLGIVDMVLEVLEEPVQVLAPLSVKFTRTLKESVFYYGRNGHRAHDYY